MATHGPAYIQKSFDTHNLAEELSKIALDYEFVAIIGQTHTKDDNNGVSNRFIAARTDVLLKRKGGN